MAKKNKLLKQVDHDVWNQFVGLAKILGKTASQLFEDLAKPFIKKNIREGNGKNGNRKTNR